MDAPLGPFRELSEASRLAGRLGLVAALGLTVILQRVQLDLKREEAKRWWVSNGRDLINAVSLVAIGAALWAMGLSGPVAFLIGATVLLVLHLFESFLLRWPRIPAQRTLSFVVVLLLVVPVLVHPGGVQEYASRLAAALFP